jgi:hypothetical protein
LFLNIIIIKRGDNNLSKKLSSSGKKLYEILKSHLSVCYLNVSQTEIYIRCPYCNDSTKSTRSAHFYIESKPPHSYYCQRCETFGSILTIEVLKDLKIYDNELQLAIYNIAKNYKYEKKKNKEIKLITNKLLIPEIANKDLKKLKYINNRLGIKIDPLDAINKFKIITNLKNFIIHNNISLAFENEREEELVKKLHKYCVGFLSYDYSNIIFRSLDPNVTGFRYHCYNIFKNYENTKRFYTISNNIDVLNPSVNLIMTEGIIDLLGVYNHFYKDKENCIFVAVNGKGYNLVIQHLARMGFLDMEIEIYSDSDVDLNFYKNIKKYNTIINDKKIKIYKNKIGKDYGVKKDEINLSYTII